MAKTTHNHKTNDYKLVTGSPSYVEAEVLSLLANSIGWDVHGKTYVINVQGTDVVVQPMIQYV